MNLRHTIWPLATAMATTEPLTLKNPISSGFESIGFPARLVSSAVGAAKAELESWIIGRALDLATKPF